MVLNLKQLYIPHDLMERGTTMISVIVPVYNSEKYLVKCLNSLRYQTYHRLEIILINDGSTDSTREICERYCKKDTRFRLINTNKIGVSAARNVGLLASRGQYVGFVHPGDWVEEEMFEQLMTMLLKYQAEIVVCKYVEETKGEVIVPAGPDDIRFLTPPEAIHLMLLQKRTGSFLGNKLFSVKFFKSEPSIAFDQNIHLHEDLDVCSRLYLKSRAILFAPEPRYHYMTDNHTLRAEFFPRYLSGLPALLNTLDFLKTQKIKNVSYLIKEMYLHLNLDLIMLQYEIKPPQKKILKELKRNLYRFKFSEIKDSSLKWKTFITRINIGVGYYLWHKKLLK